MTQDTKQALKAPSDKIIFPSCTHWELRRVLTIKTTRKTETLTDLHLADNKGMA